MPFRATFDCLWCGTAHACRGPDDLEGWAQLCPTCVGKAGDNGFLRFRLRDALTERGAAARAGRRRWHTAAALPVGRCRLAARRRDSPRAADPGAEMLAYYEARAPEYDDWYLRRGRYARGPIHDAAWNAELDAAGRWLDGLPIQGEIVELAAGTGWWSPLLAAKGELSLYDGAAAPLDRARERLVAHQLRAHLHLRDAWAEPDRAVDAVFTGFWLSHVRAPGSMPSSPSSGAGSSPAARSPSSTLNSTRNRVRPTIRRRPTMPPSAVSTTAASSRSSRSTTSRPTWRRRWRAQASRRRWSPARAGSS